MDEITKFNLSNDFSSGDMYIYDDNKDTAYIANLFVEESERKKGYGGKLISELEKLAILEGVNNIQLKVELNSFMYDWYQRLGYEYLIDDEDKNYV